MHIVVLGGGGAMGRITVRALAEDDRVTQVTVADLRHEAAERVVAWLGKGRDKARAVACDVRDHKALVGLLDGAQALLNATDYPFNLDVMRAALAARAHYADLGGLFHMTRRQYELHDACREAGITAVLGIGSTPGITNVLARVAVDQLDRVERLDVRIGSGDVRPSTQADAAPFIPPYSIRTIFDECTLEPMIYRNGRFSAVAPMSGQEDVFFPAPIGRATAMYTLHSEVTLFPASFKDKGLKHASFKIAFPPEFLAKLKLLVGVGLARTEPIAVRATGSLEPASVAPRELFVALMIEAQTQAQANSQQEPSDCDVLRVVAEGKRAGQPITLVEEMVVRPYRPWRVGAGDLDTGVPLAIAGILLASGDAPRGALGAEVVFEPHKFLHELARYEMRASETITRALG
ncbi:MAG TPA: saccharopine dehydrogenase NADP-binding domain-containing protein [Ktedonobacterales bacterium]|nr:saccharopine dehydrogenase NADP-binding domain-containing protein [Ktedonobacterales bacterium]